MRKMAVAALFLAALPAAAFAMDDHIAVQPNELKWGPPPPGLPPARKSRSSAAIQAEPNPMSSAPSCRRATRSRRTRTRPMRASLSCPAPSISRWATSSTPRKVKRCGPEVSSPPKTGMQHYGWSTGPTLIQIHGMGPFAITYVNPADDPRNKRRRRRNRTHTFKHCHGRDLSRPWQTL